MDKNAQEISKEITQYLEGKLCSNPPEPFVLAGRMMTDLNLKKSEFYIGIGRLMGFQVGEYAEGKKRYYYLLEMVHDHREKLKRK